MNKKTAKPTERKIYSSLIKATVHLCFADMIGGICDGMSFPGVRIVLHFGNMMYFFATTLISFIWLLYVIVKTSGLELNYRRLTVCLSIPLLLFTAVLLTNPWTKYLFYFDETNTYIRGPGLFVHWIFSWGYLAAATAVSVAALMKKENRKRRDELRPLVVFVVFPIISSVLQVLFYGVSALQCGITLSIVVTLFNEISRDVSLDALTGLNNRTAMSRYISAQTEKGKQHFTVLMMDINHFKKINDSVGHAAGDLILIRFSNLLKEACGSSGLPLFLYRFGGDEFVIIGRDLSESSVSKLIDLMEKKTEDYNRENPNAPVPLSFSVGAASGACKSSEDVSLLLSLADERMYQNKKEQRNAA